MPAPEESINRESNDSSFPLMLSLIKQTNQLNAKESHITLNNIQYTKGQTGVISVYQNTKPAHMVLEELYEWAEKNDSELVELIEKISNDMSWNT